MAAAQPRLRRISARRRATNAALLGLCGLAGLGSAAILLVLLGFVLANGLRYVRPAFLLELPTPMGVPGGGIAHALAGSALMVGLACLWSIPLAIGIGIFLAEYGRRRLATVVRFVSDVLVGVPSIVVGMFGYTLVVLHTGGFSALAGAFALGFIILPIVGRTTEESLRLVPGDLREAALALGVPRWRTTLRVVLPAASTGVVTGAMLGLSRVAGETAPLLFTALGNNFWNLDPTRPTAAMTLSIYTYALSPFDYLHEQAWAASFFLLVFVLLINILARRFAVRKVSR